MGSGLTNPVQAHLFTSRIPPHCALSLFFWEGRDGCFILLGSYEFFFFNEISTCNFFKGFGVSNFVNILFYS